VLARRVPPGRVATSESERLKENINIRNLTLFSDSSTASWFVWFAKIYIKRQTKAQAA